MNPADVLVEARGREERADKSYLSAAADYIPSWGGSRTATPKPVANQPPGSGSGLKNQHGGDHQSQHWHGLSQKRYPADCPPLTTRWFYAVDVPKRKPKMIKNAKEDDKPITAPKKFVAFTPHDSRALEVAYQDIADTFDDPHTEIRRAADGSVEKDVISSLGAQKHCTSTGETVSAGELPRTKVPVHEDYLFDVDIGNRELAPVYWLGPIYEVRRGSWFYQEGTTQRACEENLAAQLEEGYLKIKPFRYPKVQPKSTSRPTSWKPGEFPSSLALSGAFHKDVSGSGEITPKASFENLRATATTSTVPKDGATVEPQTHRLFGSYMNSVVTYQDSTVAWLSADTLISRMSSTVYQRFAGGGYLSGVKLVRGYLESSKGKEMENTPATPTSAANTTLNPLTLLHLDEKQQKLLKRRSAPPDTTPSQVEVSETPNTVKKAMLGETEQEADESDMRNDYKGRENENQARRIDHLILVTHGIGQRLGMRTESVNFIHDVNVLRQTLKNVYESSADLQALNYELENLPKNCRIQVLPICWRHLLDFPKKNVRQSRREQDLGDAFGDEDEYPSLEDITPDGVQFVRSLISDLALDILLYQSSYRDDVIKIVLAESNRIYNLFKDRNPTFHGKVSLIGHSLGSAIFFDLLCRQKETPRGPKAPRRKYGGLSNNVSSSSELEFDFEVEDFYCLGSPIGLFQMLKGRNILARQTHQDARPAESPLDPEMMQDPFLAGSVSGLGQGEQMPNITGLPHTISSPKVAQLFNIFYPSDPISYRLEPLISSATSKMHPQPLPYTKKTYASTVSGLGAKVGQSVSGLWSSFSAAMASSMLNKSLGLTTEDVARMESHTRPASQSTDASINIAGGVPHGMLAFQMETANEKKRQLAESTAAADRDGIQSVPVLIDDEMETLFAGFEKRQKREDTRGPESEWSDVQRRRLRHEEAKLKALNRNGRVDYSIQEGVLDFNPMSTIASHLGYWADEDVAHFLMSMSLSRHRNEQQDDHQSN